MNPPSRDAVEKLAFLFSLLVLAFLYGYASRGFGWFPTAFLESAWRQARVVAPELGPPHWVEARVYDRKGARTVHPGAVQPGLTLIAGMWKERGRRPGLKLIAPDGRTVHEWPIHPAELFPDPPERRTRRDPGDTNIHGTHLYPNGDVVFNLSYVGTAHLDACGRARWTLPAGSHHSVERAEDGSLWVSGGAWSESGGSATGADGLPGLGSPLYHDRVVHVSEDGELLEEIDVLTLIYTHGLERYISKGSESPPEEYKNVDVIHLNDVEPLDAALAEEYPLFESGDLAVSLHHLDLVLVFDPGSGRVKWHLSDPFIQQHDPDFIGDGWIGVFDNNRDGTRRGTMLGGSRVVAVQPHTDSTRVLFPTPRSEPFYTADQGKWQQLGNGNLLLTETNAGRVVEVAPDGRTVWEWITEPYDESKVPEITEGTRYDLTEEEVSSWPCSPGESAAPGVGTG